MQDQLNAMTENILEFCLTQPGHRKDPCMSDLLQAIHEKLSPKDILEIDLRSFGSTIYSMAIGLSRKVNEELLSPISKWLNDPEWMTRFSVCEENVPNWALYKRRQRHLTKRQKAIFAERMKLYWSEIQRKRTLRKKVAAIIPCPGHPSLAGTQGQYLTRQHLTPILAPFSPSEQKKAEIRQRFCQVLDLSISDLLPWKFLLTFSLSRTRNLSELPLHYPENRKKDIVSKLIHLLYMETNGEVSLTQTAPFGEIIIEPNPKQEESRLVSTVTIIDKCGEAYEFDWQHLTDAQRNRVIADIKGNRILCKVAE